MKSVLNVIISICALSLYAHGGVGHGNPKVVSFTNTTYDFGLSYSPADFVLDASSPENTLLTGLSLASSYVRIHVEKTAFKNLNEVQSDRHLENCAQGDLGGLSGFYCDGSYVLLVPGKEILTIQYSNDSNARAVIGTFQILIYERTPFQVLKDENLSRQGFVLISVFDSDQNLLIQTENAIQIYSVNGFQLIGNLPDSAGSGWHQCETNVARNLLLCVVGQTLKVWNLTTRALVWTFSKSDLSNAVLIDDKTAVFGRDGSNEIYQIKIGTQNPKLIGKVAILPPSTAGDAFLMGAFSMNSTPYLVVKDYVGMNVVSYPALHILEHFDGARSAKVLLDQTGFIVRDQHSISRFDPSQNALVWTREISGSEFNEFAVGKKVVAAYDPMGNVRFYDLLDGSEKSNILESIGQSQGQANHMIFDRSGEKLYRGSGKEVSFNTQEFAAQELKRVSLSSPGMRLQFLSSNKLVASAASEDFFSPSPTHGTGEISIFNPSDLSRIGGARVSSDEVLCAKPWVDATGSRAITANSISTNGGALREYDLKSGNVISSAPFSGLRFSNDLTLLSGDSSVFALNDNRTVLYKIPLSLQSAQVVYARNSDDNGIDGFRLDAAESKMILWDEENYTIFDIKQGKIIFTGNADTLNSRCRIESAEFRHGDQFMIYTVCGTILRSEVDGHDVKVIHFLVKEAEYPDHAQWGYLPMLVSPNEKFYLLQDPDSYIGRIYDAQTGNVVSEIWGPLKPACHVTSFDGAFCGGLTSWVWLDDDTIATSGVDSLLRTWRVD